MAQEGAEALPARIVIVTGKSRSKEDDAGTAAKEAIVSILAACNSPFQVGTPHPTRPGARSTMVTGMCSCILWPEWARGNLVSSPSRRKVTGSFIW